MRAAIIFAAVAGNRRTSLFDVTATVTTFLVVRSFRVTVPAAGSTAVKSPE
jgi:hypothetical protein